MNPCASAGKQLVDEQTLYSLGWKFHGKSQTWNFHNASIPCLSRSPISLEDLLLRTWAVLVRGLAKIEDNMKALGVSIPGPMPRKVPTDIHEIPDGIQKRPGLEYPNIGAPGELHKFLDAVVDTARKQGARVQITLDPNRGQAFDPLRIVEQMLGERCPHCRGEHG